MKEEAPDLYKYVGVDRQENLLRIDHAYPGSLYLRRRRCNIETSGRPL